MTSTENTPSRFREFGLATVALILIAGALCLTFAHVLRSTPDDISGRYDIYRYYGPSTFYMDYCLSQGELPLWNPLVYCGVPNAANPQSFVFYPPNLVRSLTLPEISPLATQKSMIGFIGLHLLLLGMGTYLLGRAHNLSFPAALLASLAWVCSALIVRRACEYHFLYTMAWLPLILLMVKHAIDSPTFRKKLLYCIGAGILLGISILGGFLQIVSYIGVSIASYAILYRIFLNAPPATDLGKGPVRRFSREVLAFGVIFFLGVLLAFVLLVPVGELAGFSARQKGMPVPMYSDMMKWDVTRLYQSIVVFPGMRYEAETLRGSGLVAVLLVIAGCFHRNRKLVLQFAVLAYALIDCGFGPPFPIASVVSFFTPFSESAFSRGFDFALLPLALLAGMGVDTLWQGRGQRPVQILLTLVLLYGGAATVGPLISWTASKHFLPITPAVYVLPLVALAVMLVVLWIPRTWRMGGLLLLLFPILLFAETWSWNKEYVPWMIKKGFRDVTPIKQSGHHFPTTNSRGTDPIANRDLYSLKPVMNGVDPLHFAAVRDLLSGTPRDKRSHRLVTDWEPTAENHRGNLLLKRYFWLSQEVVEGPLPDKQKPFPVTTTTFLPEGSTLDFPQVNLRSKEYNSVSDRAIRIDIPNMDVQLAKQREGNLRNLRFDIAPPSTLEGTNAGSSGGLHTTLVIRYQSTSDAQIDTRLTAPGLGYQVWAKRHRVKDTRKAIKTLEVPLPDSAAATINLSITKAAGKLALEELFLLVDPADEDGLLTITDFSANGVTLDVGPLSGPRVLTFLDAWYPGWHAYVDGQEVLVLKADDVFKAIHVPAGQHEVRFEFRPRSVSLGMAGTGLGLTLAFGGLFWLGVVRRDRKSKPDVTPVPVRTIEEKAVDSSPDSGGGDIALPDQPGDGEGRGAE